MKAGTLLLGGLGLLVAACGTVGPPIPPEEIGIAAKVEKEKTMAKERAKQPEPQPPPPQGPQAVGEQPDDDDLPDDVTQPLVLPR